MRTFAIICLVALMAACAPKTKSSSNMDVFTTIDTDKDGKVSMTEVLKASKHPDPDLVRSRFEVMDTTSDGYLGPQEFDVWRGLDDDTCRLF